MTFAQSAHAGLWLQATGMSSYHLSQRSFYTGTVAIKFLQGFGVGAQYLQLKNSNADTAYAYGPKAGLFIGGFEASATYLLRSSRSFDGNQYTGGGYALNVGYSPTLLNRFRLGVLFTHTELLLNKKDGASLIPATKISAWSPMLALALEL